MKLSKQECKIIREVTNELDCKLICRYKHEDQTCIAITSDCLLTVLSLFFMMYAVRKQDFGNNIYTTYNDGYDLAASLYQINETTAIFKDMQWFR